MDKVILLKKHLKNFKYFYETDGDYGDDGMYVPGEKIEENFKAVPFPVDANTLKLYPEGAINVDDILLYTKKNLNNTLGQVKRESDGEVYQIFDKIAFLEVADVKVYLVKRVDVDG
ncbi:MAG: hypothetical protein ACRC6U_09285 [Fusobacteriaceae bacterium]